MLQRESKYIILHSDAQTYNGTKHTIKQIYLKF